MNLRWDKLQRDADKISILFAVIAIIMLVTGFLVSDYKFYIRALIFMTASYLVVFYALRKTKQKILPYQKKLKRKAVVKV